MFKWINLVHKSKPQPECGIQEWLFRDAARRHVGKVRNNGLLCLHVGTAVESEVPKYDIISTLDLT